MPCLLLDLTTTVIAIYPLQFLLCTADYCEKGVDQNYNGTIAYSDHAYYINKTIVINIV